MRTKKEKKEKKEKEEKKENKEKKESRNGYSPFDVGHPFNWSSFGMFTVTTTQQLLKWGSVA